MSFRSFTVSETVETVVFTPLRKRRLTLGVGLNASVGNALDSCLFLALAFGAIISFGRRRLLPAVALEPATATV